MNRAFDRKHGTKDIPVYTARDSNLPARREKPAVVSVPTTDGDKEGIVVFSRKAAYMKPSFL
ncbi:hypothetical protein [Paenibacillus nasutitermitis]|uniref:Uncharacterized protein n=1 Tax=Paenibacillus nasutitermitis TaxID=1652958 RepID=A0A917DZY4_9BACL|nr:hypothetical protein [Paenibacillus nasutitermitis]GGD87093.1 hypothetical protein GCM10010911_51910 [Paenibacillus nasutitermitis]